MPRSEIEITGNLVRDPELRSTTGGVPVCSFTVAVTPRERYGDTWKDSETQYWVVSAWRSLGEHVAGSLERGDPVTVSGRVTFKTYETKEGAKRIQHEINAERVSVPLDFHIASPVKPTNKTEPDDASEDPGWEALKRSAHDGAAPFAAVPRLRRIRQSESGATE
jgi:single-strand DNA-binding protein